MLQQLAGAGVGNSDLGEGVCIHHVCDGRARIGIAGLRSSPQVADLIARGLAELNGVKAVRPSTLTGNVVVLFDPEAISWQALVRLASAILRGDLVPGSTGPGGAPWHTMSVQAVAQGLMTSVQTGLSTKAASIRIAESGKNVLSSPHVRTSASILADQVKSFPVAVLAGAAVVSIVTGALIEAVAISAVVALNAAIGYLSESRAERVLASLDTERAPVARLLRDGRMRELPAEELVPGDIIQLQRGDVVTADARLIQAAGLSVSESALTGESLPVAKTVESLPNINLPLAERTNMVYRGTVVTGGSAMAIVVGTGMQTEVGRVQSLVAMSRPPQTPMQRQLDELGKQLVWITGLGCLLLFGIGLLRGRNAYLIARSALTLAVAAIPEGLPMIATTALAVSVERMRRRGMVVRRINAVETLASVDVVCFDKTGTLTLNQMSVAELASGARTIAARDLTPQLGHGALDADLRRLLEICCLCSEVELEIDRAGNLQIEGSATEAALIRAAVAARLDPRQIRSRYPLVGVQHRSEAYRFMATLHHAPGGTLVAVKGDPVEVISRCAQVLDFDGRTRPMTAADRAAAERTNHDMASRALRVLGFAFTEHVGRADRMTLEGLTWIGLAGLSDPVRPGIGDILKQLEAAGVRSIMLTGDGPVTARAVAAEIGLGNGGGLHVLTAGELNREPASERARLAREADIFARVSPAQKLEIVRALQSSGAIVAMLGDGINDSPALRAADVGLAVGRNGDSAAKEVADIYLENEDLSLLLAGIEQGRATQDSVQRSLRFLLGTNSSEVALVLTAGALDMREALNPAQLLWINLVTDVLPGIALTLEPAQPGLTLRKPRPPDQPIVGKCEMRQLASEGAVIAGAGMAAGLLGTRLYGWNSPEAQTMTFASLVGAQLLHAFNCRSEAIDASSGWADSPPLDAVVYGSLAVQAAASFLPLTQRLLGVVPIAPIAAGIVAGCALLSFLAARKTLRDKGQAVGAQSTLHFVRDRRAGDQAAAGSGFSRLSSAD